MPPRRFDPRRVRMARVAAELTQEQVGVLMGVSGVAVGNWEHGKKVPDPEKLPMLATVLNRSLDELFPRSGPPDLADLRCDAGYAQYRTKDILGTSSAAPVSKAERGLRRLNPWYVPALAEAYSVSADELLAAQERSFGNDVPTSSCSTARASKGQLSLSDKITYLDDQARGQGQTPPTDEQIASIINHRAGSVVVSGNDVRNLRTGAPLLKNMPPVVIDGLAQAFGVLPQFFLPEEEAAQELASRLAMLASLRSGRIDAVAARSGIGQPNPKLVQFVNDLLDDIDAGKLPGAGTDVDLD